MVQDARGPVVSSITSCVSGISPGSTRGTLHDRGDDAGGRGAFKGALAGEHLVGHRGEGKDIAQALAIFDQFIQLKCVAYGMHDGVL